MYQQIILQNSKLCFSFIKMAQSSLYQVNFALIWTSEKHRLKIQDICTHSFHKHFLGVYHVSLRHNFSLAYIIFFGYAGTLLKRKVPALGGLISSEVTDI